MKLESKKVYTVEGVSYLTKKEANIALAKKYLDEQVSLGVTNVIDNASEIIKHLRVFLKK